MTKRLFIVILSFCILPVLFSFVTDPVKPNKKQTLKTIIIDAGHGLPNSNAEGKYSYESQLTLAMALKLSERLKEVLPDCNILLTRTDENLPGGLKDKNIANRWRANFANENHGDLFISIHVNDLEPRYQRKIEGYREETYTVTVGKGKKKRRVEKTRSVPIYKSYKLSCDRMGTETYIWAVNKYDQKQNAVGSREGDQFGEKDSSGMFAESPDAKILASLRTKKYFDQSLAIATFVEEEFKKEGRTSYGVKQRNNEGIWVLQATNMPSILVETGFICNFEEEDYMNSEKGQNEISYALMRAVLRYKQLLETGSGVLADPPNVNISKPQ
ncbi:N-acetylmuramoyl-L-alanine amidase [Segetibacter sp.]|jgi:N-acetylmuramoyl-L-alanine amidase|uniref:N-acetylmuramoyl-L-alanine amidase family protein n=1 Tax=Segetibacter sp. TaxID=2231182 RepID=UPI002608182E|nr:N-acetylmuramoyl-L-alanine amidase [Segetibacter sp.]